MAEDLRQYSARDRLLSCWVSAGSATLRDGPDPATLCREPAGAAMTLRSSSRATAVASCGAALTGSRLPRRPQLANSEVSLGVDGRGAARCEPIRLHATMHETAYFGTGGAGQLLNDAVAERHLLFKEVYWRARRVLVRYVDDSLVISQPTKRLTLFYPLRGARTPPTPEQSAVAQATTAGEGRRGTGLHTRAPGASNSAVVGLAASMNLALFSKTN